MCSTTTDIGQKGGFVRSHGGQFEDICTPQPERNFGGVPGARRIPKRGPPFTGRVVELQLAAHRLGDQVREDQ